MLHLHSDVAGKKTNTLCYPIYGTHIWYSYMVLVYGTHIWYSYMVLVYGSHILYSYMVLIYGTSRGFKTPSDG